MYFFLIVSIYFASQYSSDQTRIVKNTVSPSIKFSFRVIINCLYINMQPISDWYESNKLPVYVIFLIYIAELKAKRNFAIDGHVNYMCMKDNRESIMPSF